MQERNEGSFISLLEWGGMWVRDAKGPYFKGWLVTID